MASDSQIRANRANAQKSTGPRTQAGKDKSRLNPTRHNITGMVSLRSGPEKAAFDAFFDRMIPVFDIENDLEYEISARIIDTLFRLARVPILEDNILATAEADATAALAPGATLTDIDRAVSQARAFMKESRTFSNLSLYEQRLSRTLDKDLETLRQLQNPQAANAPKGKKNSGLATQPFTVRWVDDEGNDTLKPIKVVPPFDANPKIGFVFSSPKPTAASPGIAA